MSIVQQLEALRAFIGQFPSALTAYSGGVDSAVVMRVAYEVLGARALACIGVSPSYAQRELRAALALVEALGAPYRLVYPREMEDGNYAANATNRCYFCKRALHAELGALARREGYAVVFDGTNADDVRLEGERRPGIRAAREHGVRSPLAEVGISKEEVRGIAQHLGMEVWDKPAMACLSSRVPYGVPITGEVLRQIEAAEEVLYEEGLRQVRVRHHGEIARLEVMAEDMGRVVAARERIVRRMREVGYRFVTLDLAGFHSGSLHPTSQPIALVDLAGQ